MLLLHRSFPLYSVYEHQYDLSGHEGLDCGQLKLLPRYPQ